MSLIFSLMGLAIAQLDINTANISQLEQLEYVNHDDAEKIVNWRVDHGEFSNIEALRVLSFSEDTLDSLRSETIVSLTISKKSSRKFSSVGDVLASFDNEPDIRATQAMAMEYSKTNPELMEKWLVASKRAYALPKVNLQYEKKLDESNRYDYVSDADGALVSEQDYAQVENDDKMVVKLEWRLDKLVMSSEQIRVINESSKSNKLREKILDEVTRLYFDRRRLQVEALLSPPSSLKDKIDLELRLQEMTANLDALTGGGYSASIKKPT
jgi:hypothetical protein